MHKLLVLFLCAVFAATTCARSPGISVFQISNDLENNEVVRDSDLTVSDEKLIALAINEVEVDSDFDLSSTEEKRPELETNELHSRTQTAIVRPPLSGQNNEIPSNNVPEERQNDVGTSYQKELNLGLIDQSKAPTTTFEYVMEFLYGLCHWVYKKFIS